MCESCLAQGVCYAADDLNDAAGAAGVAPAGKRHGMVKGHG